MSSNSELYERYQFVSESPSIAIFVLIVLVLAALLGTFGNALILLATCMTKNAESLETIFIANLAISDMFVTSFANPMNILAKLEGESFFNEHPGLCKTVACLCTIACINSLGSITLMSFNRYIYICHHDRYGTVFKKPTCISMCVFLYCVGLGLVLLNMAGIGDHSFDRKSLECIWDRMATYYFTVVFSIVLVWIPVILTGFMYFLIFLKVKNTDHRINRVHSLQHNQRSIKLARTLFIIYAVFSVCWIPYALVIVADRHDTFPYEAHLLITTFAHLHPSVNWLVYYFTNTKFRQAFDRMIKLNKFFEICQSKKANQVEPSTVVFSTCNHDTQEKDTNISSSCLKE